MNCKGCTSDSCFSCGYKYGIEMRRDRIRKEYEPKRLAAKARRRRRSFNSFFTFVLALALLLGLFFAARAAWDEPEVIEVPTFEIGEPTISATQAMTLEEIMAFAAEPYPLPTPLTLIEDAAVIALPLYTEEEREILAIIIYQEAGADYCSNDTRLKVGTVFLNRVASDEFPDTFYEVATAEAQYGTLHWTGIQWPDRASSPLEAHAVERAYEIADQLLAGYRSFDEDVIWQAEFPQGTETISFQDGIYFCK